MARDLLLPELDAERLVEMVATRYLFKGMGMLIKALRLWLGQSIERRAEKPDYCITSEQ
jgi:hypothetical protein